MKKKIIAIILALAGIGATAVADGLLSVPVYLNNRISIKIQGKNFTAKETDGTKLFPLTYNDRTYLPVRAVAEALGANIDYDGETNTVVISTATPVPTATSKPTATPRPTATPKPTASPEPTARPESEAVKVTADMSSTSDKMWTFTTKASVLKNPAGEEFSYGFVTKQRPSDKEGSYANSPVKLNLNGEYTTMSAKLLSYSGRGTIVVRDMNTKEYFGRYAIDSGMATEIKDLPIHNCKNLGFYLISGKPTKVFVADITLR